MTVDIEENGGGHEGSVKKYESNKLVDKDHIATPRWVVEQIYDLIDIKRLKCAGSRSTTTIVNSS